MFLLSQNDENQSENGSKNSKIRLRATCGTAKKDVANQKIEVKKLKNTGFFHFACRFWTGAFTNRCLPYCFLQCFLKASVTTYQKQEVLAEKCPPPGKPVTFYECHPDDHAPAPSVRADFLPSVMFDDRRQKGKWFQLSNIPVGLFQLTGIWVAWACIGWLGLKQD